MAIVLTVVADGPAALAELWGHLGGNKAEVDIVGDEMFIAVDLTTPEPEPDDPYGELTPEQEAQVEEVLSHPIHPEGPWEDAEAAPEPEHDGHTVDVGPVEEATEPEPAGDGTPTVRDQVVDLLNAHPDRTFTVAQVYEHVEGSTSGSVGATLKWLTNNGRIRRVARGEYQAIDRSAVHDARRRAAAAGMFSA